ncbi:malectin [Bacteroides sp. OttesenSCG-928-E20]|nr:malectin [Bacteroides sp. OttesenSCG-928-N06]MDL2299085.1 malectin [Bacteroides sp. OttesenSCG-928-E20]MDL2304144.1 malectin [Bacteroides sp. OttesenSCG-928-D19]
MNICFSPIPVNLNVDNIDGLELAINVGSNCFYTSTESSLTWVPDKLYQPGRNWGYINDEADEANKEVSVQTDIKQTPDGSLFQRLRSNPAGYRLDVPPGEYELELLFADVFNPKENLMYQLGQANTGRSIGNTFDILINGQVVNQAYAPAQESGQFSAARKRYIVRPTEGAIDIRFHIVKGKSFLNGLKLRKLTN